MHRRFAAVLLLSALPAFYAGAQSGLKTINPPKGGAIVYGRVDGQTTEAGAMGAVLRSVHQNLGEKPQVGRLFQVHGTQSVAAFFSANRRIHGSGQVAGLLIVTKVSTDHVEAGLITDEAARFPHTLSQNTKTLFAVWHPLAEAAGGGGGQGAPVAPLHQVVLQDNSASIELPEGWILRTNQSGMGTIVAGGPNGEGASMDVAVNATDINNPRAQQIYRAVQSGQLRGTVYANAFYYPYGGNLARAFVDFMEHMRQKNGLGSIQFNFSSATPMEMGGQRCAHLEGITDFQDGKGTRELNTLFCEGTPGPASGGYLGLIYSTSVPIGLAPGERATLGAVMQSFRVNQAVLSRQIAQVSGPSIAQIHAIGQAVDARVHAAHQAEDIHNSSVYQHWDSMDKRSQEFENYQLGYSVLSDNENNAHGTFWDADADALVKSDPNRFEYVSAPNYWKGIDY